MKKLLKVLGIALFAILLLLVVIASYVKIALPNVGAAPQITIEKTPERTKRGAYLAKSVMICMDCHSSRNPLEFSMPMEYSTMGEGGERFDQSMGFPGVYYSANITPSGIGNWTDGEIYRAVTTGVRKNGNPIFPVMPYHSYRQADPDDIKSVIAFLRSLNPIQHIVPEPSSDFPMNFILNTIPEKADPHTLPPTGDSVANGKYLFNIAACHDCHTPYDKGKFLESAAIGGGRVFPVPGGMITSANITPDKETGIGSWTKEMFVQHFAAYRDSTNAHRPVHPGEMQTIMPWTMYGNMTDKDLSNIYAYIQTIKPINNKIVKWKAQ
jgi:mono/diheme cytochrome c family protein